MCDCGLASGEPSGLREQGPRAHADVALRLAACAVASLWLASGCAEQNGVLEIDSGPPIRRATGLRAGTLTYAVHVGECPTMIFRSKVGTCDYAVMFDESKGRYVDCGPCLAKQFEWKYALGDAGPTEQPIRLMVSGYVQKGSRDRMPLGGEMVDAERRDDDWDYKLAQAAVLVEVYQSVVEIAVTLPKGRPDWSLTKLVVAREEGQQIKAGPQTASERGFAVSGPDDAGVWQVRFEPKAAAVNRSGETAAELQLADEEGQVSVVRQMFATP